MKLKKQKYLILLAVTLFNALSAFADPTPPAPGGGGGPGGGSGGVPPPPADMPIDSEIVLLLVAGLALGAYKVIKSNKKRQLEN